MVAGGSAHDGIAEVGFHACDGDAVDHIPGRHVDDRVTVRATLGGYDLRTLLVFGRNMPQRLRESGLGGMCEADSSAQRGQAAVAKTRIEQILEVLRSDASIEIPGGQQKDVCPKSVTSHMAALPDVGSVSGEGSHNRSASNSAARITGTVRAHEDGRSVEQFAVIVRANVQQVIVVHESAGAASFALGSSRTSTSAGLRSWFAPAGGLRARACHSPPRGRVTVRQRRHRIPMTTGPRVPTAQVARRVAGGALGRRCRASARRVPQTVRHTPSRSDCACPPPSSDTDRGPDEEPIP